MFKLLQGQLLSNLIWVGSVRLVYKPLVLICMADLLGEKNIVPWLKNRLIMAAEQSRSTHPPGGFMGLFNNQPHFSLNDSANLIRLKNYKYCLMIWFSWKIYLGIVTDNWMCTVTDTWIFCSYWMFQFTIIDNWMLSLSPTLNVFTYNQRHYASSEFF